MFTNCDDEYNEQKDEQNTKTKKNHIIRISFGKKINNNTTTTDTQIIS